VNAVLEETTQAPFKARWPGHGDLTIRVTDGVVYVHAGQLEQLAQISPWTGEEQLFPTDWHTHKGDAYYTLEEAVARLEATGTPQTRDLLTWLRTTVEDILTDEVLDRAYQLPSFMGSQPVALAASLLSTPTVPLGRKTLFAHMHHLGWITRHDGDWELTTLARRSGWLTIRDVSIPAATKTGKRTYPQIYVTPAGLEELATTLGHAPPVPHPPPPTLFD
jgi:hypothetical protein